MYTDMQTACRYEDEENEKHDAGIPNDACRHKEAERGFVPSPNGTPVHSRKIL